MELTKEAIERLQAKLRTAKSYADLMGKDGAIKELLGSAIEEMLEAEMTNHLGYEKHSPAGRNGGNSRNGKTTKAILSDHGEVLVDVPRDREGSFEPVVVRKHERRLGQVEDAIISMYGRGMSTRDIQQQIEEIYGATVSATAISMITDRMMSLVIEWQSRPLERTYPIVYFDAIYYNVRQEHRIVKKAAYTCLAMTLEGQKDLLGIWVGETESASFWLSILTELRQRGVEDILIACVDGLKGFPEAMEASFPRTEVQLCIIHQIRSSTKHVNWKDLKAVMRSLKDIYKAPTLEAAEDALVALEETWGSKYPQMVKSWKTNWGTLSTYFKYPELIRRLIYTTNVVEGLHRSFRKVTKTKTAFPHDDALRKILFLVYRRLEKDWVKSRRDWDMILMQLSIFFKDRIDHVIL